MARRSSGFDINNLLIPAVVLGVGYVLWKNAEANCSCLDSSPVCQIWALFAGCPSGSPASLSGLGDVSLEEYPDFQHWSDLTVNYVSPLGVPMITQGGG